MANRFKILIIDPDYNAAVDTSLALAEFENIICSNAAEAIIVARSEVPQLILLEVELMETNGIDLCIELRKISNLSSTLIVFYSQRNEDYFQIAAFNAGADDYIIKPSKPRVLIIRLKALLKRFKVHFTAQPETNGLIIDRERYLIFMNGSEIILPRKQFELLALLYSSPTKVYSRNEIASLIWGYEIFSKNRTIDVHIRKLREKLGDRYIKTIKGVGYSLE